MMLELRGMPVARALTEKMNKEIEKLSEKHIIPKLAVIRVGEQEDDISYEKGIVKRFSAVKAMVDAIHLPCGVTQDELEKTLVRLNHDPSVHGILLFRPLPGYLSQEPLKAIISKDKDVDGMGIMSSAAVYEGSKDGYAPCTAQAVMEILKYYNIEIESKKAVIIGRRLVVGKPLSMLLLGQNATTTLCHKKTINLADECKKADILIACAGSAKMVGIDFTRHGQVVIDVGINMVDGELCGDVDYDAVAQIAAAITPVPGGVGAVTTSVLLKNTVDSAMKTFLCAE